MDCKDLRAASTQALGDQIELAPAAVPAMNAATGQYSQILQLDLVLTSRDDQKKHDLADDKSGRSYFTYWKGVEEARKAWLQKGDDLVVKYYKHTDGHVEIRISKLEHTGENGNQTISNTAITYRAVKAADGGQK